MVMLSANAAIGSTSASTTKTTARLTFIPRSVFCCLINLTQELAVQGTAMSNFTNPPIPRKFESPTAVDYLFSGFGSVHKQKEISEKWPDCGIGFTLYFLTSLAVTWGARSTAPLRWRILPIRLSAPEHVITAEMRSPFSDDRSTTPCER